MLNSYPEIILKLLIYAFIVPYFYTKILHVSQHYFLGEGFN